MKKLFIGSCVASIAITPCIGSHAMTGEDIFGENPVWNNDISHTNFSTQSDLEYYLQVSSIKWLVTRQEHALFEKTLYASSELIHPGILID